MWAAGTATGMTGNILMPGTIADRKPAGGRRDRGREDGTTGDGCEHQRERIATSRDGEPTQTDPGDNRSLVVGVGQPRRRRNGKIDHPRNHRQRFVG